MNTSVPKTQEKFHQLALHLTPGLGGVHIRQLLAYCGSAQSIYQSKKETLKKIPGIGIYTVQKLFKKKHLELAEKELFRSEEEGISMAFITDKNYPKRLREIYDAPAILFYKGKIDFNKSKTIAIVGTRNATDYGKSITEDIVAYLKGHDATIISGLAYGIDIQAHTSALKHGLQTIGVMASGFGTIYPFAHKKTAKEMLNQGGLTTENVLDTKPDAPRFPARNRIIAGLSDATIVVEAAKKGGALITAEMANGYHRDVFAVPGSLKANYSEGCNNLIKSHKAHLLNTPKDIEYIMQWDTPSETKDTKGTFIDFSQLDQKEKKVVSLLQNHGDKMGIDEISWKSQLSVHQLANVLLGLEFEGYVKSLPGKKFRLN